MPEPLALIAVHAHPDDESSKGAATMAKYAAEGVRVVVATFTGGEAGGVLNPHYPNQDLTPDQIAAVRREEMAQAAAALGIEQHFMGFHDSGFPEGDPPPPLKPGTFATVPASDAAWPLVELIREVRPQVLTTYDASGGYPHPDHIHTHTVTLEALRLAADAGTRPELGPPHRVAKVYYDRGFSPVRFERIHQAMLKRGQDSPFQEWIDRRRGDGSLQSQPTTKVNVAEYFPARDAALRAHATQIDPQGFFFAVPRDLERLVWPWEEFDLAFSLVEAELPETDLFAGIR